MNRWVALGMLVGVAIGLVAGAMIAKSLAPASLPAPAASPPSPAVVQAPAPPVEAAPDPEVAALRAKVADLEAKLAARDAPPPVPAKPPAADAPGGKPAWITKLDELLKKGLSAYKGADFGALVAELKEHGPAAIEALADKLLNAESAGERFLAAALMEDLDDPAAIPALARALQKDDDLLVRRMSSHALALIENEAGLPPMRTAMTADVDWGVRVNAAYGVAKQGHADGLKLLEDAYQSSGTPAEYKLAVFGGLADVASASSLPIFKKVLSESTDLTYLYLSIGAIQKLKDATAIPELNRIVGDAKYPANVREMAKKAIDVLSK